MKDLIRISNLDLLLVQETKLEESEFLQTSARLWKKGAGVAISARGASGGIGSLWNSSTLEILKTKYYTHWILTNLLHKESGIQVSIFNLDVLVLPEEKKDCWNKLREFLNMHQIENIIIVGDLNVTLSQGEKKGGTIVRDPIREWIEDIKLDWELEDIKPSRGKNTWSNKRNGLGHIAARLDRFLVQSSLLLLGLNAESKILHFSASDHKPISLEITKDSPLGPIPFRFSLLSLIFRDN
jgi:exonuclease III